MKLPDDLNQKYPRQPTESLFDWHKRLWTIHFQTALRGIQDPAVKTALEALKELMR